MRKPMTPHGVSTSSPNHSPLIAVLQNRLHDIAGARTKIWWERYLKGVIEFRGVNLSGVRTTLHAWVKEYHVDSENCCSQFFALILDDELCQDDLNTRIHSPHRRE